MRRMLIAVSLAAATLGAATSAPAWPDRNGHSAFDEKGVPVPSSWTATAKLADYDAQAFATDTRKAWLQLEWSY